MADKFSIANILRETGMLLNVMNENPFKAKAYITGAQAVEALPENVDRIINEDRLTEVPGIGLTLARSIREIAETGELRLHRRLKKDLPADVIELARIPGLTLRRIKRLHESLNVNTVEDVEKACLVHKVCTLRNFGEKTETAILEGIRAYREQDKRILLVHAQGIGQMLVDHLAAVPGVKRIEVAGKVRRWHEVVDEIILVAQTSSKKRLLSTFASFPLVTAVDETSSNHWRVRHADGISVELRVVDSFPAGLTEATGSADHFAQLQEIAKSQGLSLSSQGLYKGGRWLRLRNEPDLYQRLKLSYIPPELREGIGELQMAEHGDFEDLIDISDIVGMTHCHSTYSDGIASIEQMALGAQRLGMKYMTITDHSPAAHYAGGLSIERLKQQWEEIDRVQEKVSIRLLKGTECDILADGTLDYPDHILDRFDIIIASVHARFKLDFDQMTRRVLRAMRDPHFKIWGHPLGRLVLRRPPINCDVEKILDAIAGSRAAIEINGDPYRLDLEPRWIREARDRGIKFVISTDAHALRDYRSLEFGVHLARRAGVRKDEVLNTYDLKTFQAAVRPRRSRA